MNQQAIGFIGLGRMGSGMACNLAAAGVPLTVYDGNPQALGRLVEAGASPAASPAEVAGKVRLLFLCLPFGPQVRSVLFGDGGVAGSGARSLAVVDTTTLDTDDALAIAAQCEAAGIGYSDCPISGMPFRAENGTLTMMFGGTGEAFEAARPYLEVMGEFIVHCGALGAGQTMKALNNVIYDVNIAALCEVMPLALKAGLDARAVARVFTTASSRSFASEYFVPRILARRFDSDFPMGAAYKDIVNVQKLAVREAAAMPVVNAMVATYQQAIAAGHGDEPKSAMIKIYEKVLGIEARADPDQGDTPDGGGGGAAR